MFKKNLLLLPLLICFVGQVLAFEVKDCRYDINRIPFSCYGSYLVIDIDDMTKNSGKSEKKDVVNALYIREISGKYAWSDDRIFKIEAKKDGEYLNIDDIECRPGLLRAQVDGGSIEVTFHDTSTLRVRANKVDVYLTKIMEDARQWEWTIPISKKQFRIQGGFDKYVVTALDGSIEKLAGERSVNVDGDFVDSDDKGKKIWSQYIISPSTPSGSCEFTLERYLRAWKSQDYSDKSFDESAEQISKHFEEYVSKSADVPTKYKESLYEANYVNWIAVVEPRGLLVRPTMYMSKKLMRHVWSWDHCFNAMALAYHNYDLAWDQFMVFFDMQDQTGALLDYANDYFVQIDFVKPPIHGLILSNMMKINGLITDERLEQIYQPLSDWTNFWFTYRDDDNDGLPQYNHGNDSGWDNGTLFAMGYAAESPDLCAYLITQMDALAIVAEKLNKNDEAIEWTKRANRLQELMIKHLWRDDKFVATQSGTGAIEAKSQSLMAYMPLLLGDRLPANIRDTMLLSLKNSGIVTKYGPASEHPNSVFFEEDGYWRGAIWPSSTYLLIEGVKRSGDLAYATELAQRYVDLCHLSGFRENHSAITGAGLRDYGYTWTSSVFISLAHEYLYKDEF